MNKVNGIKAYLVSMGCTEIAFAGAWVTFTCRDGKKSYASINELAHEARI